MSRLGGKSGAVRRRAGGGAGRIGVRGPGEKKLETTAAGYATASARSNQY